MTYNLRKRKPRPPPPADSSDEDINLSEEDEDYDPDKPEYEESETGGSRVGDDEEVEDEDEEEQIDFSELGRRYRMGTSAPSFLLLCPPSPKRSRNDEDADNNYRLPRNNHYSKEEKDYLKKLGALDRKRLVDMETSVGNPITKELIPLRFRILSSPMEDGVKRIVLAKLEQFSDMSNDNGEYFKLKNWLDNVAQLPFHKFHQIPVSKESPTEEIVGFMNNTKRILDETVYGHTDAKQQILRILAQWISNPTAHGHCIGIHGPMGIGKTSLIKEGLSKALGIPFGFIALGGATDSSFLDGHSYTYEGSTYGKIAEILIRTQCSNPILFFDELDKVSSTKKGEEIFGVLTHLTDMSQNEKFSDKYFGEIDLNLSRSLIVFSYNDENMINPILKDRLITIKVNGYKKNEKIVIAKDYLLPTIFRNFGMDPQVVQFTDEIIGQIIDTVAEEEGVRNLKRGLECVISWVNMYRYMPMENKPLPVPFVVDHEFIIHHLTKKEDNFHQIRNSMYI